MAQSVVYADLKFATAPPPTAPACPTAPDEDDCPYENVALGPVFLAPSTEHLPRRWPRRWRVPAGLVAASLLLLLLLATIALGACYWQVTRTLHDASREHAAEQGRLSQEVSTQEQRLEQMQLELAWAQAELQRAWREGNSSWLELESLNAELRRVMGVLGKTEKEMQEVQGKLNNSESTAAMLRACVNTDCCPAGWVLYRSKCLFVSVEKNSWQHSQYDCRSKSASLLVQGSWPSWTLPNFLQKSDSMYWVGAKFFSHTRTPAWQDSKQLSYGFTGCGLSTSGKIESSGCWAKHKWICERPPQLSS
ncbi:B-cell differentiation antigen CD72-like [Chlamydotis macqueenii]